MMNYRAYKVPRSALTLQPTDAPALYTYALSTSSPTIYHMSWNGATEVSEWRILGRDDCSSSEDEDNWTEIATIPRTGFETTYRAESHFAYGLVEARSANGSAIKNSTLKGVRTFVPSPLLADSCDEDGCAEADEYSVLEESDIAAQQLPAQIRQACPATPQELSEESERVEELRSEAAGDESAAGRVALERSGWAALALALVAVLGVDRGFW
jgi:hypothetical protein